MHVGDIASLHYAPVPPVIERLNRQTVIHVGANVAPGFVVSNVLRDFEGRLRKANLPSNISVYPNTHGNQQNLSDTVTGMTVALALALVLVFLLMVALFNSYRAPFIIIFAVPVAVVGALGSLALTHQTLNLFSLIGTVLLIGLVTKNGILLVDFADKALARGRTPLEAIREAAQIRFRPIVMTTCSMVAGIASARARARPRLREPPVAGHRRDRRSAELARAHAAARSRRLHVARPQARPPRAADRRSRTRRNPNPNSNPSTRASDFAGACDYAQ